jgi:hypothetical protein
VPIGKFVAKLKLNNENIVCSMSLITEKYIWPFYYCVLHYNAIFH